MMAFWYAAGVFSGVCTTLAFLAFMVVLEPDTTYVPPKGPVE